MDDLNSNWKLCLKLINCSTCLNSVNSNKLSCKQDILYHLIELLESYQNYDLHFIGKRSSCISRLRLQSKVLIIILRNPSH